MDKITVTFCKDTPLWELHQFAASRGCVLVWDPDSFSFVEKKAGAPRKISDMVKAHGDEWRLYLHGRWRRVADANATTEFRDFLNSIRADFKEQTKHLIRETLSCVPENPELRIVHEIDETKGASK